VAVKTGEGTSPFKGKNGRGEQDSAHPRVASEGNTLSNKGGSRWKEKCFGGRGPWKGGEKIALSTSDPDLVYRGEEKRVMSGALSERGKGFFCFLKGRGKGGSLKASFYARTAWRKDCSREPTWRIAVLSRAP